MKRWLRKLYVPGRQAETLFSLGKAVAKLPLIGTFLAQIIDLLMLYVFGIDGKASSVDAKHIVFGHTSGIVLGANGIKCSGTLHLSSGVVLGRRYGKNSEANTGDFFDFDGDVTIGANSVLLGPLRIKGPVTIGALSLVTKDILEPGVYVGAPVRKIPISGETL